MVSSLAKDCVVMKLKNEIYESYLKRQNPFLEIGDVEENKELTEEESKILKELENSELKITSKELYWKDLEAKKQGNQDRALLNEWEEQNIDFLISVVEREIGELYRTAKKNGIEHDKKYAEIQTQQKSLEEEIINLEEGLKVFQTMFGELLKSKRKKYSPKIDPQQLIQYFQQETKRLDQKARRIGVQSALVGKELKRIEDWRNNCSNITPVDLEVLQIDCENLQVKLDKNHQEFLKLKSTLDKLNRKVVKETESTRERDDHLKKITKKLDKMKRKVHNIKTTREQAEKELIVFEMQRKKLLEEGSNNNKELSELNNGKQSSISDWDMKKARSKFNVKKNIVDNFETF